MQVTSSDFECIVDEYVGAGVYWVAGDFEPIAAEYVYMVYMYTLSMQVILSGLQESLQVKVSMQVISSDFECIVREYAGAGEYWVCWWF